ncbi:MAG: sigma-70 family RNA polymerase sigma factor [Clostridiales bacterium]|nr:sigma-70 family RNA polymerase sigma factor [Clostridiales bacterium]
MEDSKIIELYFERSESAIRETQNKYGRYCHYIAYHILYSDSDAEECVNDTYYNVWDIIPPKRPTNFRAFIGAITRNLALNRYDYNNAQKRSEKLQVALDELNECAQGKQFAVEEELILKKLINGFLDTLPKRDRIIFLQRYWYFCSVKEIASNIGIKENNVKVILYRVREQFKNHLEKEGVLI